MFRWLKLRRLKEERRRRQEARATSHAYWRAWNAYDRMKPGVDKRWAADHLCYGPHDAEWYTALANTIEILITLGA